MTEVLPFLRGFAWLRCVAIAVFLFLASIAAAFTQTPSAGELSEMVAKANAALARRDFAEALRWNFKAAELGDPLGQVNLGAMFHDGVGVQRNYNEAMKWYRIAATNGNIQAEKDLGDLYMDMSVPEKCRDPVSGKVSLGCFWVHDPNDPKEIEALKWYLRAAEKAHPGAMTNLARMFAFGYGAKQDCTAARKWLQKAAAFGNQTAVENLRTGVGSCNW